MKLFTQLKKTRIKKVLNLVLLGASFLISRISGKVLHWGNPITLSIEPTNHCNLNCPECGRTNHRNSVKGYMDQVLFNKMVTECSSYLFSMILYFQGEPFLHPGIFEMIKTASKKQIYTITSTNGQNLEPDIANMIVESGLNEIIISMDGMDQVIYEKYRIGGDIEKVKTGIRNLVESKKNHHKRNPEIILQFLVFSHNQHQVNDVKNWGKMIGVDRVNIKTARMNDYKEGNLLIPDGKYSRYKQVGDNRFKIKSKLKNHCWRSWSKSVLTWDGNVLPCCFDMKSEYIMGNIGAKSFNEIWKGDQYNLFRYGVLRKRKAIPMCCNCTEGVIYSVK